MRTFIPPMEVAQKAKLALAVRKKMPPSQRGGTSIGLARARQLANRQPVSIRTIKRMVSYFARHEVDKQAPNWNNWSKGKQAWGLWGSDAGREWAELIYRRYVK